jgi:acyl-coenzyme A synthetase/AMP-(fatty) acid ligase
VVDDAGEQVPDGEIGTLEVTGPTVALEYYGAPAKTARTFHGDTLRTEDLFVRDPDGFFSYRGRADDMLKVGGVWVAPSEIEHCLIGHPAVVECAVVGHLDEAGLVRPRAYVVPHGDGSAELEAVLREYVRAELAPYKVPRDVRFVSGLPKTANGKLDRRALRVIEQQGVGA